MDHSVYRWVVHDTACGRLAIVAYTSELTARREAALPIAPPHVSDRVGDELLEHRLVEIGQLLEVEASLAHPVFAELGQQDLLSVSFGNQIHHQFAATDGEAR